MSTTNWQISSNEMQRIKEMLVGCLEGTIGLHTVLSALQDWVLIDFEYAPDQRRIVRNELEDQFEIQVERTHVRKMLKRFQRGRVSSNGLSNWAAFIILSGFYVPKGETEEERWQEGEGPVWDILQRLMSPSVFGGLDKQTATQYINMLRG